MVFFQTELGGFFVLAAVFMTWGTVATVIFQFYKGQGVGFIAKVMEEVGGTYSLVKKVSIGVTQETFNVGDLQFVKDESKVSSRESWNHWGGNHPVLVYDIRDAKPMANETEGRPAKPKGVSYTRDPKPSSASTNLIFRRGGLKAMMSATKSTSMDPRVVGVMVGIAAFAGAFLLAQFLHPGLVSGPPPGYYFKTLPIPQNVTIVH